MQIRELRESKGLTQEALANRLSVKRTTVSMWESGESMPRADKLAPLAKLLGCTVDELLKEDKTA